MKEELNAIQEAAAAAEEDVELKAEDLEQVAGGAEDNQGELKFCKYCCTDTFQTYVGIAPGWDGSGRVFTCDLWLCKSCGNTNYRETHTGELI